MKVAVKKRTPEVTFCSNAVTWNLVMDSGDQSENELGGVFVGVSYRQWVAQKKTT